MACPPRQANQSDAARALAEVCVPAPPRCPCAYPCVAPQGAVLGACRRRQGACAPPLDISSAALLMAGSGFGHSGAAPLSARPRTRRGKRAGGRRAGAAGSPVAFRAAEGSGVWRNRALAAHQGGRGCLWYSYAPRPSRPVHISSARAHTSDLSGGPAAAPRRSLWSHRYIDMQVSQMSAVEAAVLQDGYCVVLPEKLTGDGSWDVRRCVWQLECVTCGSPITALRPLPRLIMAQQWRPTPPAVVAARRAPPHPRAAAAPTPFPPPSPPPTHLHHHPYNRASISPHKLVDRFPPPCEAVGTLHDNWEAAAARFPHVRH